MIHCPSIGLGRQESAISGGGTLPQLPDINPVLWFDARDFDTILDLNGNPTSTIDASLGSWVSKGSVEGVALLPFANPVTLHDSDFSSPQGSPSIRLSTNSWMREVAFDTIVMDGASLLIGFCADLEEFITNGGILILGSQGSGDDWQSANKILFEMQAGGGLNVISNNPAMRIDTTGLATGLHTFVLHSYGGTVRFWIDGTLAGTVSASMTSFASGIGVGNRYLAGVWSNTGQFNPDIAYHEIVVAPGTTGDSGPDALNAYLTEKWVESGWTNEL